MACPKNQRETIYSWMPLFTHCGLRPEYLEDHKEVISLEMMPQSAVSKAHNIRNQDNLIIIQLSDENYLLQKIKITLLSKNKDIYFA